MKTVHVAAGIIRRGGESDEVLAVQRGYGDMQGLWEFPGGKVERGETPEDACIRELQEELQVRVTDLRDFYTVEYDYEDFHLSMECFFCRIDTEAGAAEPQCSDRQLDIRWISRRTLASVEWMPADKGLVEALALDAARPDDMSPDDTTAQGSSDADDEPPAGARPQKRKKARTAKKKRSLLDGIDTSDLTAAETELVRRRAAIKKSMQGNKRANTKPEMLVRQRLRAAGLTGYRLQWKKAPGRPDIAFPGRRIAIFVNGCFWHRCPHCHPSVPKRNTEFWEAKFRRNVERDAKARTELAELGWTAITIWECELKRDRIDETMDRVIQQIRSV
ncbi:DNA mismatch endonuclease Vsr [Collinsella tanakaei]|uniref:DNA mismatch endonuclease Vsr n=1 Tax=Collinsella tanakaei TaxID=626935 RepID=UPI0025A32227|nr:DNA mismatch endonuclease Vsr [Collinsella tanakaei]MDM8300119.1 DNA mismatch endonuclease Vsr [Collinsella tanakaei]